MTAPTLELGTPVLPVVTLHEAAVAVEVARALLRGGVPAIEVTLRTPAALAAIRAIASEVPEMLVGAGTITTPAELETAIAHGARFGLSPGATPKLLAAARDSRLPFIPGVTTASELMLAMEHGFNAVKFFPAASSGGVNTLANLSAPFPRARFCPTGGISLATAPTYLALDCVFCVGGSWLTPAAAVVSRDWTAIEQAARAARALKRAAQ